MGSGCVHAVPSCDNVVPIVDGLYRLVKEKVVRADEEVVVFNTGAAQKYPEVVPLNLPRLDRNRPVDYGRLAGGGP